MTTPGEGEEGRRIGVCDSPVFLMGKSDLRCMVDGSSFMRSDSCRLKGDVFWLRAGKPRKEPCRAMTSAGAWRRGMACGPGGGDEDGEEEVPPTVWLGFTPPKEFTPTITSASVVGGDREGIKQKTEQSL